MSYKNILVLIILTLIVSPALAQKFDVEKFSDPAKYNWNSSKVQLQHRNDLQQRQKLLQVYEMNKFNYRSKLIKSALVPGWTHFSAGKYAKGQVILGLEVALFVSSFYYYDQAMNYNDK